MQRVAGVDEWLPSQCWLVDGLDSGGRRRRYELPVRRERGDKAGRGYHKERPCGVVEKDCRCGGEHGQAD